VAPVTEVNMPAIPPVLAIFGGQEWIFVLLLFALLFGAAKLPGIARNLGRSVGEFKAGLKDEPEPQKPSAPQDSPAGKN